MTENKERALRCLLTSRTKAEAAKAAGIAPRTLRDYFNDPEFVSAYREALRDLLADADRQARQALSPALQTLVEIAQDADTPAAARVQAARALLEAALKLADTLDFAERLAEIEKAAASVMEVDNA